MLKTDEFFVGYAADAQPLSLMLARGKYENPLLIARRGQELMAVFIGEKDRFHASPCADNTYFKGVIVPNVSIELDSSSMFDSRGVYAPEGCLIRCDTRIVLVTIKQDRFSGGDYEFLTLVDNLKSCSGDLEVGFRSWSVVIGDGSDKRTLMEFTQRVE